VKTKKFENKHGTNSKERRPTRGSWEKPQGIVFLLGSFCSVSPKGLSKREMFGDQKPSNIVW